MVLLCCGRYFDMKSNLTFAECLESRAGITKKADHYSALLNSFPKNEMGLTPDIYRKTNEFTEVKKQFNFWFNQLREVNKHILKNFKKEYYEYRKINRR